MKKIILFFMTGSLFLSGCWRDTKDQKFEDIPCIAMQQTTWFLPGGKKDWWKVVAEQAQLQERNDDVIIQKLEARLVKKSEHEVMCIVADSGRYERTTTTFYFEGNVSTKVTRV